MKIAIVGTGAIGSTFAYRLARSGHDVTAIARGERLAQLRRDEAIVLATGERAKVAVAAELDPSVPYDLVLVTVLAPQVGAVLPALAASAAREVMFMFNTFEPLEALRDAVGKERFVFGFPGGIFALLRDGVLAPQVRPGTTVGDARWAKVFAEAGIPTDVEADMHAWLRSHAAMVVPVMAIGTLVSARGAGATWSEARAHAEAMAAGFRLVRDLGHPVLPSMVSSRSRLPKPLATLLLWAFSRTKLIRDLGSLGPAEARMLIDQMLEAAPRPVAILSAIRP